MLEIFQGYTTWLVLGTLPGENVQDALQRLGDQAVTSTEKGTQCLILDDYLAQKEGLGWLDPMLAVSSIDEALRRRAKAKKSNLRRRVGLVIRSASIRNLHDIVLLSGLGVDAVAPYALFAATIQQSAKKKDITPLQAQETILNSLKAGLEKVISTMGCHELRGYGRVCSSIGLSPQVAAVLRTPNYFGAENAGITWDRLDKESVQRCSEIQAQAPGNKLDRVDHFYPKLWKQIGLFAKSQSSYDQFLDTFDKLKTDLPVALRHVIGFKEYSWHRHAQPGRFKRIEDHDLPFLISAMSFGSQGEPSFRAYAEAAAQLNIICINGEGGELSSICK